MSTTTTTAAASPPPTTNGLPPTNGSHPFQASHPSPTPAPSLSSLPPVPNTEPLTCAFDALRIAVARHISTPLNLPLDKVYEGVDAGKKSADFTVAMARFRLGGKPEEWSKKVIDAFVPDEWVESAEMEKGFVSFMIRTSTLNRLVLTQIHDLTYNSPSKTPSYGCNSSGKGKKVVIEYSSPNIAKEFHAGHLRSTIIGAFLTNLHRAAGWDVTTINYLGDWGKQFGMVAVGFERYGSEEALERDAVHHLYDVYVRINRDAEADPAIHDAARDFFRRMEEGDEVAIRQWKRFRDFSLERYRQTYERLNIEFDVYGGESTVSKKAMEEAVRVMEEKGIVEEGKEGSKLVNLDKYKLGTTVLQKKDGTSLYITRDIAGAIERWEKYHFDKMIYVVASQQDLHLAQTFKVLSLMGFPWADRLSHINFGMVAGMSSRKGNAVSLDRILNDSAEVMHEQMRKNETKYANVDDPRKTADEIGMSAVKVQDMAAKRINNYTFNWARMLSFEGDTGPYLQYAHARLCSVQRKAAAATPPIVLPDDTSKINTDLLSEPGARAIVYLLASYPEVVRTAIKTYEPSGVVTFCFRLSHAISGAWETLVVLGQEEELALARLWLFVSARDVLGAALRLLSIRPLERM